VLAPLHLAAAGWGATAIGAVWLIGGALEAVESPLIGRLSDRRGALLPVRFALGASALASLALATGARPLLYAPLVVVGGAFYGALFTPAFALIADGAERAGLAQGWPSPDERRVAIGAMVGPAAAERSQERPATGFRSCSRRACASALWRRSASWATSAAPRRPPASLTGAAEPSDPVPQAAPSEPRRRACRGARARPGPPPRAPRAWARA